MQSKFRLLWICAPQMKLYVCVQQRAHSSDCRGGGGARRILIFTIKTTCSLLVLFRRFWATFCSTRARMWGEGKISICPSAGPSVASSRIPHVLAGQRFNLFTTPVTTRSICTWRIKRFHNNSDYWAIVEVIIWANFQTTRLLRLLLFYNNYITLSWISLQ